MDLANAADDVIARFDAEWRDADPEDLAEAVEPGSWTEHTWQDLWDYADACGYPLASDEDVDALRAAFGRWAEGVRSKFAGDDR
jgi:hypothetical protein